MSGVTFVATSSISSLLGAHIPCHVLLLQQLQHIACSDDMHHNCSQPHLLHSPKPPLALPAGKDTETLLH